MRILIDQGAYELLNMGDLAMLQSCVARLRGQWPAAEIMIITHAPGLLATHCPDTVAIPRVLDESFSRLVPPKYRPVWQSTAPYFSRRFGYGPPMTVPPRTAVQAVRAADVVVASGGGYMADAFRWHATGVLSLLWLAQRLGKPTAMFGQGIGPIGQRGLRMQARAVFPSLWTLTLREAETSRDVALSLGASPAAVEVTGDEALELVDPGRSQQVGQALGINMRVAGYAGVDPVMAAQVGGVVLGLAAGLHAPVVALPVSRKAEDADLSSIRSMLRTAPAHSGIALRDLTTPEALITAVGRCRAVVTGSYHAAVFSLAQGVPAVCLARSSYYSAKFAGLQALFPGACFTISLDEPDFTRRLHARVTEAWHLPVPARKAALEAARRQRDAGREAYAWFRDAVEKNAAMDRASGGD